MHELLIKNCYAHPRKHRPVLCIKNTPHLLTNLQFRTLNHLPSKTSQTYPCYITFSTPSLWLWRDVPVLAVWVSGICALTLCSLDRSGSICSASEWPKEMGRSVAAVLFMSCPCWVGRYSASKSQMWLKPCSIHCHDCWPLITSNVPWCWISAEALCCRAQNTSLIAQRSITRPWHWTRVFLPELIPRDVDWSEIQGQGLLDKSITTWSWSQ